MWKRGRGAITNRTVCLQQHGHYSSASVRKWDLFATDKKRDRSPFCPFVSLHVPSLCNLHAPTLYYCYGLILYRTPLSSLLRQPVGPISLTILHIWRSVAGWHALRGEVTWLKQMTNADSHMEEEKVNQFFKLGLDWTCRINFIESEANGHGQRSWNMLTLLMPSFRYCDLSHGASSSCRIYFWKTNQR